jgi:uncharacterized iron-regulated protein
MKQIVAAVGMLVVSVLVYAQSPASPDLNTIQNWSNSDYILLGEVHDNAAGHALRQEWLKALVTKGRFALAMEQLDRENQALLTVTEQDLLSKANTVNEGQLKELAKAGSFSFKGWQWSFYEPLFKMAVEQNLPLIATNLSQSEMMSLMTGKVKAFNLPSEWHSSMTKLMQERVEKGHCNMLPKEMVSPMASAQIERDRSMAEAIVAAHRDTHLPVILVAGNGHLREDLAVPFWIKVLDPKAKVVSVAVMEEGNTDNEPQKAFTSVYYVPAQDRADPCEELKHHRFAMPEHKK